LLKLGVSANAITWISLWLGIGAGVAVGAGQLGLAGLLCVVSAVGDALDGYVARASGQASDAGEVLDAAVDRVTELALLAGAVILFRTSIMAMVLTLLAILACFMVSYTTAKSEALQLEIPRGTMRRGERAVLLTAGTLLTPSLAIPLAAAGWPAATPLLVAMSLVATLGNLSWIRRTIALFHAARRAERKDAPKAVEPAEVPTVQLSPSVRVP
jgi:CDP-diacylglycerol--glycerol-3-phosphate 3-phosphatidyltransferase